MMRTLRDLLTTWESWSARDTLRRAREAGSGELDLSVTPLDALRDATELIGLLSGWRWQAVYAARIEHGASWAEIGQATRTTATQAEADYREAVERQERYGIGDVTRYRAAL
jgi:hypothetical protein